jgi:hypothetical protein
MNFEEKIYELVEGFRRNPDGIDLYSLPRAVLSGMILHLFSENIELKEIVNNMEKGVIRLSGENVKLSSELDALRTAWSKIASYLADDDVNVMVTVEDVVLLSQHFRGIAALEVEVAALRAEQDQTTRMAAFTITDLRRQLGELTDDVTTGIDCQRREIVFLRHQLDEATQWQPVDKETFVLGSHSVTVYPDEIYVTISGRSSIKFELPPDLRLCRRQHGS